MNTVRKSTAFDAETPSVWIRVLGITGAVFMVPYGIIGACRGDLHVSVSKSGGPDVHLHGPLAWLCCAGITLISISLIGLLAPELGDGEFNFAARRRRFGPFAVAGFALYLGSQAIAGLR